MRIPPRRGLLVATLLFLAAATAPLAALDQLPEFSGEWVNGEPFVAADIRGKMIVLCFFEESSTECKTAWIEINKAKAAAKPEDNVIFIAINSGTPKAGVMLYTTANHLTWRVLADESRAYEKQFGFRIDKTNYCKLFFVRPNGSLKEIDRDSAEKQLKECFDADRASIQWKLKPAEVPAAAKAMWTALELGTWKYLCGAVETNLRSREPKLRECAEKCDALIKEIIQTKTEEAQKVLDAGDKWAAYKLLYHLTDGFQRRSEARPAYAMLAKLANDSLILKSQNGRRALDQAGQRIKDIMQPGAKAWYEAVEKNFAGTEPAEIAKALVESAEKDAEPAP